MSRRARRWLVGHAVAVAILGLACWLDPAWVARIPQDAPVPGWSLAVVAFANPNRWGG